MTATRLGFCVTGRGTVTIRVVITTAGLGEDEDSEDLGCAKNAKG